MAFSIVSRGMLRCSKDLLERNIAISALHILKCQKEFEAKPCMQQRLIMTSTLPRVQSNGHHQHYLFQNLTKNSLMINSIRQQTKKAATARQQDEESDSDSDCEEEHERSSKEKLSSRGDSEFWRRKMRTLHRILDVNRDGVISFDDFNLLAKRFTDLGHLAPEVSAEFLDVLKQTWEEQFGEINTYNLVTAEQFLTDLHHRLNDKKMAKRIGRFLPYLFKAVDYDHSGHLDLEQYKLFFRCLGLSDEDAAISFAVIDKNGDGQLSMKEFVHLGRQYFLTEDETKISKMFWGPLIDH